MPLPTNQTKSDMDQVAQLKTNLYADSKVRFSKSCPMLQKTEDGKMLWLPMVVLTPKEEHEVQMHAYNDTAAGFKVIPKKDEPGYEVWTKIFDDNVAVWTVLYAARLPTDISARFFLDKQMVEDTYSPEEMGTLCNNYLSIKLEQPLYRELNLNDPDAFQSVIDRIKKDGENSNFFLNGLTTHTVNQLVKYLVSQLPNSPNANGSSGEP